MGDSDCAAVAGAAQISLTVLDSSQPETERRRVHSTLERAPSCGSLELRSNGRKCVLQTVYHSLTVDVADAVQLAESNGKDVSVLHRSDTPTVRQSDSDSQTPTLTVVLRCRHGGSLPVTPGLRCERRHCLLSLHLTWLTRWLCARRRWRPLAPQLGILQSAGGRISRRLGNRGSLTSKRGNQDYYKGKGGRKEGHHTKHGWCPRALRVFRKVAYSVASTQRHVRVAGQAGGYVMVPKKMLEIVAPDLTACEVRPMRCGVMLVRHLSSGRCGRCCS